MNITPRWVNLGLLSALVAVGVGTWLVVRDSTPSEAAAARTATVTRATVTSQVSGTGNLASATTAAIDFSTGGTLTKISVDVGDVVDKGDLLARIDPADAKSAVTEAEASLESAQAQYDEVAEGQSSTEAERDRLAIDSAELDVASAEKALARAKKQATLDAAEQDRLVEQAQEDYENGSGTKAQLNQAKQARAQAKLKSKEAVDQADDQLAKAQNQLAQQQNTAATNGEGPSSAELTQAKSSVSQAQAALDDAEQALADTQLRAPTDGTVMAINGEVGETTGSSSSSSGGDTGTSGSTSSSTSSSSSSGLIVLTDLTALEVTANVAEADIGDVEVGQIAQVTLSASGTLIAGTVTQVALEGTTSNNVVQYPVTVGLDEVPDGARLGASATVVITTGSAEDVLSLPSTAITTVGRTHTVTLVKDGVQTATPVEIGLEGTNTTEIVSGVAEGDTVALSTSSSSGTSTGIPGFGGSGIGGLGGPPAGARP